MQIASTEGLLKLAATSAGVNLINIEICETDRDARIRREFEFLSEEAIKDLCYESKVTLVFTNPAEAVAVWDQLVASRRTLAGEGTYISPIIHCALRNGDVRRYEDGNVTRGEADASAAAPIAPSCRNARGSHADEALLLTSTPL